MSELKRTIENAASEFAMVIVNAIQGATFQEIAGLQGAVAPARRGRPPKAEAETTPKKRGRKPGRKPGRPPKAKPGRKPGRPAKVAKKVSKKPGRPAKAKAVATPAKKKRPVNFPKCSFPGCGKNRYTRGNGMCGEHFRAQGAGKKGKK
jgi:hypothetical protein